MNKRNNKIDYLRGIAILLVVLGHTISGIVVDYENSILYNIIWTLQMPIFFVISGYINKYSRKNTNMNQLFQSIAKKTYSYMLPYVVFTFVIRGFLLKEKSFFDIKYLIYHLDSGYWFLFVLWVIVLLFTIASFIANKIYSKNTYVNMLIKILTYIILLIPFLVLGCIFGLNFLCIKLILYYSLFYLLGYFFSTLDTLILKLKNEHNTIFNILFVVFIFTYAYLINTYNFYINNEKFNEILMRVIASILGVLILANLIMSISDLSMENKFNKMIVWIGNNTLEIYLMHYCFLNKFTLSESMKLNSLLGVSAITINYLSTLIITFLIIKIFKTNKILNKFVFAK